MHWQTLLFITEFLAVLSLFHSWRLSHVSEGFPINKQQRKALKLWGTVAVIICSHFASQTSCVARWSRRPQRLIMWWTMKDAQPRANGSFIFQLQNLLTRRVVAFFQGSFTEPPIAHAVTISMTYLNCTKNMCKNLFGWYRLYKKASFPMFFDSPAVPISALFLPHF